jgi:iron complex transport system substrate-binding protein
VRIVCLSAESADICARLGAWDAVVGISAFATPLGHASRPIVAGFSTCHFDALLALAPDLVLTFSDVQAELAARLIREGCTVLATNQRTLVEIEQTIRLIGGVLGRLEHAEALATHFRRELDSLRSDVEPRPRVYFEEWPEPLVSGIGWIGEIVELVGATNIFGNRSGRKAKERTVLEAEVAAADPQIILASWCGKPVDVERICRRSGFSMTSAVLHGDVYSLDSNIILQPGPSLIEGAREIRSIIDSWRRRQSSPSNSLPRAAAVALR